MGIHFRVVVDAACSPWLASCNNRRVTANSVTEIGVSNIAGGHTASQRFFCVRDMASPQWAGRVGVPSGTPAPATGTPTLHGSALPDWRQGWRKTIRLAGVFAMTPRHNHAGIPSAYPQFQAICVFQAPCVDPYGEHTVSQALGTFPSHAEALSICEEHQDHPAFVLLRVVRLMHAPTPGRTRASWHRHMAMACLKADSSKAVRMSRYHAHIDKARALEAVGGVQ